ncbi:MAG: rhodanese-like domain-containing protein [Baekduia sp.]
MTDFAPIDVDPAEALRRMQAGEAQIIDVREQDEWDHSRIDGAVRHIPLGQLQEQAPTIDTSLPVIFQCKVGGRSTMAAQAFRASGLEAYSLAGGLEAWDDAGLPLDPPGAGVAGH